MTLIFWPGLRLLNPIDAFDPEGEGTAFGRAFFVTLNWFFADTGLGVGFALGSAFGVLAVFPSITVTLSFCPGTMLLTVTEETSLFELMGGEIFTGGLVLDGVANGLGVAVG